MSGSSNEDLLRLAFGALSPRRVDELVRSHGGVGGAVRAIVAGRTTVTGTARAAVEVAAGVRHRELAASDIDFVHPGTGAIWQRLGRFPAAPRWLFVRGRWPDRPTLAIIGTRTCTAYGEELAEQYGEAAASSGWLVVSGMAKGIDGAGHRGALRAGAPTVAVLGCGVDVVYPRRHRTLYEQILGDGAVISEYPPGTRPDGWRFPTRNRIISALSDAVLVVEAGATGGALITAGIAIDQGVPVFATPGDVDRPASIGTNRLIRDGAFPVFGPDDLAAVLDLVVPFAASAPSVDR